MFLGGVAHVQHQQVGLAVRDPRSPSYLLGIAHEALAWRRKHDAGHEWIVVPDAEQLSAADDGVVSGLVRVDLGLPVDRLDIHARGPPDHLVDMAHFGVAGGLFGSFAFLFTFIDQIAGADFGGGAVGPPAIDINDFRRSWLDARLFPDDQRKHRGGRGQRQQGDSPTVVPGQTNDRDEITNRPGGADVSPIGFVTLENHGQGDSAGGRFAPALAFVQGCRDAGRRKP